MQQTKRPRRSSRIVRRIDAAAAHWPHFGARRPLQYRANAMPRRANFAFCSGYVGHDARSSPLGPIFAWQLFAWFRQGETRVLGMDNHE
jgi:hypothetical protein